MAKLKFKNVSTRDVNGASQGETFELSESHVGPGYVGSKKDGKPAVNVPGLILSGYVEPADAETQKWVYELGAGFEHFRPKSAEKKENSTNG